MTLAQEAAKVIRKLLTQLEAELGEEAVTRNQVAAVFSWKGRDFQISLTPYSEEPEESGGVERDSFKKLPMPRLSENFLVTKHFTSEDYQRIQAGLVPQQMEEKWLIYFDKKSRELRFYRSWTGFCIFIAQFINHRDGSGSIVGGRVNRDPEQINPDAYESPLKMMMWLTEGLLLGKDVLYPD